MKMGRDYFAKSRACLCLLGAAALLCAVTPSFADRASPAWYDQNAIATAPDWHYRVPISVPAGTPVNSTIEVDVDFAALLAQLGVNGTFDANSPRVVRSTGALSTNQEFVDTRYLNATDAAGNARGEIRFILEDAGAVTYYLYFDITANTAKPANPQTPINGNFETGAVAATVPAGWTMTRTNNNFDAQIRGSETPAITTDGTGTPGTVTTDGTPNTGAQSYLLGSRTNNEPASANPAVTLTKTFVKPASCTSGFSMFYRPEGWDSSYGGATQFDFFRATLSSGATSVILVGPNATGANGNYANFPYSPNFGSNGGNAASNTNSGYGPYNGFDTNNLGGHMLGMTQARASQPWFNPTNALASFATGSTVTLTITSSHVTQYRSWFHVDDVEWCLVNATLGTPEGFGANITAPAAATTYAAGQALTVTVQADAQASAAANPVVAFVYNPSGTLVAGPVNLPASGGGVYNNASVYTFGVADPVGTWTVRIYALDASTSTIGASAGLIHIPGQPNTPQAQATYYNIDEQTFAFAGVLGPFNAFDLPLPVAPATTPITGNITTKIAGTLFSVGLIRLNAGKTAIDNTYVTAGITVELLDSSNNTGALSATTGCRSTWTTVIGGPVTVTFAAGRITANFTVNNAYKDVRVLVRNGTSATDRGCSSDNFAIRPQSFTVAVSDTTWTTAGTARTLNATAFNGAPAHKAGQPFTIRVTGVTPAAATNFLTTGNNTGNPTLRTLACSNPTGGSPACASCADGTLTLGAFSVSGGALVSSTANYTEAGTFNLDLHDTDFAAVDAADGTPDTYSNTSPAGTYNQYGRRVPQVATLAVGRFVPDNFLVTPNNVPQLRTFNTTDASCSTPPSGPKRSFTYVGQPFGYVTVPQALVAAREAGGAITTNYARCLWKINATTDVTQTYSNNGVGPVLDASLANNAASVVALNDGTGTVSINSADLVSYTRSAVAALAPFNANISLTVAVQDSAEADGQVTTTTNTPFSSIAFDSGNELRFGRMALGNAFGSALLDLPVPIETQYYNSSGLYVTNLADNCTAIALNNVFLSSGTASGGGVFTAGKGNLKVVKPLVKTTVDLCVDLDVDLPTPSCVAATSAGKPWLQWSWTGSTFNRDPKARVGFGLYRAADEFIYLRENF